MMSSVDDRARDGSGMSAPRVGADLCAARERLGWSLPAIAGHLRIRLPYLEAIEQGRIGDLPGNNAYAVGFVRTYAQSLGLDPDEIARRFRSETADINRKTELTFPVPVPERGVPAGAGTGAATPGGAGGCTGSISGTKCAGTCFTGSAACRPSPDIRYQPT